jgi:hypothetical protein
VPSLVRRSTVDIAGECVIQHVNFCSRCLSPKVAWHPLGLEYSSSHACHLRFLRSMTPFCYGEYGNVMCHLTPISVKFDLVNHISRSWIIFFILSNHAR